MREPNELLHFLKYDVISLDNKGIWKGICEMCIHIIMLVLNFKLILILTFKICVRIYFPLQSFFYLVAFHTLTVTFSLVKFSPAFQNIYIQHKFLLFETYISL